MDEEKKILIDTNESEKSKNVLTNNRYIFSVKPRIPIILIPGIMGTRLKSRKHPDGIWDPDNAIGTLWEHVLATANHQRDLFGEDFKRVMNDSNGYGKIEHSRGWGEVHTGTYKNFLESCQNHKFKKFTPRVYTIGYDWTKSNQRSCDRIITKTQDILDNEKWRGREPKGFIYIAHSMGALAARAALKKSFVLRAKCLGVVFVGGPNKGSVVFYNRFFSGVVNESFEINLVMGRADARVWSILASTVCGAFELLPTNDFAVAGQHDREWLQWKVYVDPPENKKYIRNTHQKSFIVPPANNLYKVYADVERDYIGSILSNAPFYSSVERDIVRNCKNAEKFHKWLGRFMPSKYIIISSSNRKTDMGIKLERILKVKKNPWNIVIEKSHVNPTLVRSNDGDGTVPITSQQAYKENALDCVQLSGVDHVGLISQMNVIFKAIERFI